MRRRAFLLTAAAAARAAQSTLAETPRQLEEALRVARPGDIVALKNGEWRDLDLRFEGEGEWGRPITVRAETPGQVILTGRSRIRMAGRFLTVEGLVLRDGAPDADAIAFRTTTGREAAYCRVTQCAVENFNPEDKSRNTRYLSLYGFRNRVDRCYFAGKANLGPTLVVWLPSTGEPNYHWIERNHFGPRPPLGENGGETIRVGDSTTSMQTSRTTVEANLFEQCNGEVEIISNKSCENLYQGNTFEACEGSLTLRHGNRCAVEGNFFFGRGRANTGGIRIIGEDHRVVNNYLEALAGTGSRAAICFMNGIVDSPLAGYFQVKRALVAYNTVVNCRQPVLVGNGAGEAQPLAPERCVFAYNIATGSSPPLVSVLDARTDVLWQGNLFHGATVGLEGMAPRDPMLERSEAGLWQPGPGSPALGSAPRELAEILEDALGRQREEPYDAGCFQPAAGEPRRLPVTRANTGPAWRR